MEESKPMILPCPFCGEPGEVFVTSKEPLAFDVKCDTKGCFVEHGAGWMFPKDSDATMVWNRRAGVELHKIGLN